MIKNEDLQSSVNRSLDNICSKLKEYRWKHISDDFVEAAAILLVLSNALNALADRKFFWFPVAICPAVFIFIMIGSNNNFGNTVEFFARIMFGCMILTSDILMDIANKLNVNPVVYIVFIIILITVFDRFLKFSMDTKTSENIKHDIVYCMATSIFCKEYGDNINYMEVGNYVRRLGNIEVYKEFCNQFPDWKAEDPKTRERIRKIIYG